MEDDLALAGAPRQVDLRHILDNFLRETSQSLNGLIEELPAQGDAFRYALSIELAFLCNITAALHSVNEAHRAVSVLITAGKLVP